MKIAGYGKWTKISQLMNGTRSPLQVKNRARYLMMYEIDSPLTTELKTLSMGGLSGRQAQSTPFYLTRYYEPKLKEIVDAEKVEFSDEEDTNYLDIIGSASNLGCLRGEIIDLWDSQKPLQLALEHVFEKLPDYDMEGVTEMYYRLEEENLINNECPRKRRVRDQNGNWVEATGSGGMTIVHSHDPSQVPVVRKRRRGHEDSQDFELFEPCAHSLAFPSSHTVCIQEWVRKAIEFHSLSSKNEVIGLLGGEINSKGHEGGTIAITNLYPCLAMESSIIECEMDAISEMNACEFFEGRGLKLVGWYHSHPTFAPNPSRRDIETQIMYQSVFKDGFIGIIVRPTTPSQTTCFHAPAPTHDNNKDGERLPYLLDMHTDSVFDEHAFVKITRDILAAFPRLDSKELAGLLSATIPDNHRLQELLLQDKEEEDVTEEVNILL